MARRIENAVERGEPVSISVNGEAVRAYVGETVAAALLAANVTSFHRSKHGHLRGPFCNMGTCFECLVRVNGAGNWVRACMTRIEEGMSITTDVDFANRELSTRGGE